MHVRVVALVGRLLRHHPAQTAQRRRASHSPLPDFVDRFPRAQTAQQRMVAIDTLLHGFHLYFKNGEPTRPVAVNLIAMRLWDVIAFLDDLSYGERSTPGTQATKTAWDRQIENARGWGKG